MDTGRVLCLDVAERETGIQRALAEVRIFPLFIFPLYLRYLHPAVFDRRPIILHECEVLA